MHCTISSNKILYLFCRLSPSLFPGLVNCIYKFWAAERTAMCFSKNASNSMILEDVKPVSFFRIDLRNASKLWVKTCPFKKASCYQLHLLNFGGIFDKQPEIHPTGLQLCRRSHCVQINHKTRGTLGLSV